jgi:hypothetical protein
VRLLSFVAAILFFSLCRSPVSASLLPGSFTATPENSWAYYELSNVGHGQSTTYFATTAVEFQAAIFQGYVTYNMGSPPSYWQGNGFDSIQVFSTFVQSSTAITLPLIVGGDDGHSLFINGVFVGGGGFGANVTHNLALQPEVPVLVQLVGYNGPGDFSFSIRVTPSDTLLDDVPGLKLNADGVFATVPEPTSALAWIIFGGIVVQMARRVKRASR